MLREDIVDIPLLELITFVPQLMGPASLMPFARKTKTSKTL